MKNRVYDVFNRSEGQFLKKWYTLTEAIDASVELGVPTIIYRNGNLYGYWDNINGWRELDVLGVSNDQNVAKEQ